MKDRSAILEEAAAWHVASTRDDMDWDAFTAWLEADPRNCAAYDDIALTDALIEDHASSLREASAEQEVQPFPEKRRMGRYWAGFAIAASLVLAITGLTLRDTATVYTAGDNVQQIALSDGSTIELAPHSRLELSSNERELSLDGGAYFKIRHDPDRRMTISAGPIKISDIGTEFDVQATEQEVRLEVSDGEVQVTSKQLDQPIELSRGNALLLDKRDGEATVSEIAIAEVGAWRAGRLSFSNIPLELVVIDLKRYTGLEVSLAAELKRRRFSGTLAIDNGQKALADLAEIMGLDFDRSSGSYRLVPAKR